MLYKRLLIILLLSLNFLLANAQRSAYYDALYLKSQFVEIGSLRVEPGNKELFDYYFGKLSMDSLEDKININPFLKEFYKDQQAQGLFTGSVSKSLTSIGSLNVTNLADGIARFLIQRGKEELNVAFFNRMKKFIEDPQHPEAKMLFPVTTEFLGRIATFRYAELIQSLREAFYKDLSNLVVSLNQLIDHPKYKELLKTLPEIRVAVRTSKVVSELSQADGGILPDSLIHELAVLPEWNQINSNLSNSWKLLDILSQSVRYIPPVQRPGTSAQDSSKQRRWIMLSDLNKMLKDTIALRIFIGLVYQKVSIAGIHFTINDTTRRVDSFMVGNADKITVISSLVENFTVLATDVDRTIRDLHDKQAKDILSDEDYYTYISKAINITEYGFKVANTIKEGVINDDYIIMARNANDLYKNIYSKSYNNAIMNVYTILDQAFTKLLNSPDISGTQKDLLRSLAPKAETIDKILRYGNFMASVVKAESGEEVQNALDAAALPAGSYSIKQKSRFNAAVNGYIGYALDLNNFAKNTYAHGIYAPVGISLSTGSRRRLPTLSGFVSLIDVGGIAAYRIQNDNTESLKQEVRLESIFSPSLQLFIEPFRGFPLAIGGGWRRTPKLFYSNDSISITAQPKNVFNYTILIDIPIFNLMNKQFDR